MEKMVREIKTKIAVSGGPSIGKSTLIKHLAPYLNYQIIPEMGDIVLSELGFNGYGSVPTDEQRRQIRIEMLNRKINLESSSEKFISDKSSVDYLAHWLIRALSNAPQDETDFYFQTVKKNSGIYDLVIIPPLGKFKIEKLDRRSTNLHEQYLIHTLIKGIYKEFGINWVDYSLNLNDSSEKVAKDLGIIKLK